MQSDISRNASISVKGGHVEHFVQVFSTTNLHPPVTFHTTQHVHQFRGVDPGKKSRGTTKWCIVHQCMQWINIRCLKHLPPSQNPFSVPKSGGLASAVSSPPSWPLNILSAFNCALLCLMGELRQSLLNKSTTQYGFVSLKSRGGDKTHYVPPTSKSRGDMSPCPPYDRRPCTGSTAQPKPTLNKQNKTL